MNPIRDSHSLFLSLSALAPTPSSTSPFPLYTSLPAAGHEDYQDLQFAINQVDSVASFINERIADRNNRLEVKRVQDAFGGSDKINLLKKGRRFCHEGKLWKVCRRDIKEYHFVLFNDGRRRTTKLLRATWRPRFPLLAGPPNLSSSFLGLLFHCQ